MLTLVGYSVSDTIVVFDRIREVRGKNPELTPQMINDSVNQTLSRTILSSLTVCLVVFVLYIFGGQGVHLFAFVMVVGVVVGTYSSIYIASPLLLIFGEGAPRTERAKAAAAQAAAAKPPPRRRDATGQRRRPWRGRRMGRNNGGAGAGDSFCAARAARGLAGWRAAQLLAQQEHRPANGRSGPSSWRAVSGGPCCR